MWQTRHVSALLARTGIDLDTILQISTKGDRVQDRSLAALGTDSIFVKELEHALREERADYAVHSCKDLPSSLPDDMLLAAIGPREDPRDAFCSERYESLEALPPGALVGTSSPRRRAQLQALRPDLRFDTIRGNVDTRLAQIARGRLRCDPARDGRPYAARSCARRTPCALARSTYSFQRSVKARSQSKRARTIGELATRLARARLADPADRNVRSRGTRVSADATRRVSGARRRACDVRRHGTLTMNAIIAAPDGSQLVRGGFVETVEGPGMTASTVRGRTRGTYVARRRSDDSRRGGRRSRPMTRRRTRARASRRSPAASFSCRARRIGRVKSRPHLRGAGADVIEASDSDDARSSRSASALPHALLFPSSGSVADGHDLSCPAARTRATAGRRGDGRSVVVRGARGRFSPRRGRNGADRSRVRARA